MAIQGQVKIIEFFLRFSNISRDYTFQAIAGFNKQILYYMKPGNGLLNNMQKDH